MTKKTIRIGCAGWSLPRGAGASFPEIGSHLERYAAVFNAAEINSSFYRSHRRETYARWSRETGVKWDGRAYKQSDWK